MTDWQNRIVGYTTKRADQLTGNPRNPRRHPQKQRNAVKGSLDTLGWIAPVLENVRTGYLIDGHERVMQALGMGDDTLVPVVQIDLDEAEEAQALATFDYITYMAEYDRDSLDSLLRDVSSDNNSVQELLADLAERNKNYFIGNSITSEGQENGASADDALDVFLNTSIRQVVLYFQVDEYELLIPRLAAIRKRDGFETNTDVFVKALEVYENYTSDKKTD